MMAWLPPLMAAVLTLALVPVVRAWAPRIGAVAHPGGLSVHDRPTARTGGIAIWLAASIAILIAAIAGAASGSEARVWWSMAAAATAICALGLIDDTTTLSPWPKLIVEIALALIVAATGWRAGIIADARLDLMITVLWIVFFTNAFNALDGLDGLAGGVGAIAFAFLGFWSFTTGDRWAATVSWTLAAATGAFLVYNFPPSRGVFLGDCGALFAGFSLALLVLRAMQNTSGHRAWTPFVFVCVPVIDLIATVLRRLGARSWPLHGDRRHLYDALYRRWGSMRLVALGYYTAAIIVSLVALSIAG